MSGQRSLFKDARGQVYEFETQYSLPYIRILVHWRQIRIGHAYLVLNDGVAILQDIVIHETPITKYQFRLWLLQTFLIRSFRRAGVGAKLLQLAIAEARSVGATRIQGDMSGDLAKLRRWYYKAGFRVSDDSTRISMALE